MRDQRWMPFMGHLEELRRRIIITAIPWLILVMAGLWWAEPVLQFLIRPVGTLVILAPAEGFLTTLRLAVYIGTVAASPIMLYQAISFVSPGLTPTERRLVLRILPFVVLLFAGGVVFGFVIILPLTLRFFIGFLPAGIEPMISLGRYLSFVAGVTLPFGIAFQMPVAIFLLAKLGLITAAWLRAQRKYALLVILVIAAVLTPPDVVSQLLMAAPMLILYEISILIAQWSGGESDRHDRPGLLRRRRR